MSSWSQRRKRLYISVTVVIIAVPAAFIGFRTFYRAPTCFDGVKNGNELGIDCGGSCRKLCASAYLPPKFDWARFERVAPGLYNLGAYIENPNASAGAAAVPYHMVLYDASGTVLADVPGTIGLPPHRNVLAFAPAVRVTGVPAAATFEFTGSSEWTVERDRLASLVVADKTFVVDGNASSLQVTFKNPGVEPLPRFDVGAVLYDGTGNAVGFSKTVVDPIPGNGSAIAPFTWPDSFGGRVISQEILPVAE